MKPFKVAFWNGVHGINFGAQCAVIIMHQQQGTVAPFFNFIGAALGFLGLIVTLVWASKE